MQSDKSYYFSKWTFLFITLFIISVSAAVSFFALLFYPDGWQYSLLFALPLLLVLSTLPEYIKTFYFIVTGKPAIILTKEKLIDNFRKQEYGWSEIMNVEYKLNEGMKAQGGYIAVHLHNLKTIRVPDNKLNCKRYELMATLIRFHNRYKEK